MGFAKSILLYLIACLFATTSLAQNKNEKLALKKILFSIEKQHQITFNFLEDDVKNVTLLPPEIVISLTEKIEYLQKNTSLKFENSNDNYYNVTSNNTKKTLKICGFVFSKIGNKPLQNANIVLEKGKSTTTNQEGYFEIISDKTTLIISYVGFTTKKILVTNNNHCEKYFLENQTTSLVEIQANRYLTTGISRSEEGTILLKPKNLGILPGLIEADVLQAMQQIPGINSADESVASINVRGGTHDQNLFLWNGIKMYQTGHFFGLISAFNPNLSNTVLISKNGSSAFYGESVSSVVDMNSNPTISEKNSFGAGINMINADVYWKYNLNKSGFIEVAGRKSITDYLKLPTYNEYFKKAFQNTTITNFSDFENTKFSSDEKFNFYDITLKYYQKIATKNKLIFDLITINDQLDVLQKTDFNTIIQSEKNILYQKNYGGNITFERNWNPRNKTKVNAHASYYELDANKTKIETNQNLLQENTVLDIGLKLENSTILNPKFKLNTGYQYNETGTLNLDEVNSPLYSRKIKEVLQSHATIAELKFKDSISNIILTTGLRANYFEKFKKTLLEPRLQFSYDFARNLNLGILAEMKSQTSFQIIDLQNDYFGIEKRRWVLANDSIVPIQKSKQVSISLSFTKNNWLLSGESFYKKVTGINSSGQGFRNQLEFLKINGEYAIYGTEILVQKKMNHFMSWISYTYNNNNYTFNELEVPKFSNNFELHHVISWAAMYEKNNFKVALGAKWNTGRPETSATSNATNTSLLYDIPNNEIIEKFFQVNFSATYKLVSTENTQYKFGVSVLNLLDRKNEISEYYRYNSTSNTAEDVKTFALQRTPNVSFRIIF